MIPKCAVYNIREVGKTEVLCRVIAPTPYLAVLNARNEYTETWGKTIRATRTKRSAV